MLIAWKCIALSSAGGGRKETSRVFATSQRLRICLQAILLVFSASAASNALALVGMGVFLFDEPDVVSAGGAYLYGIKVKNGGTTAVPTWQRVTVDLQLQDNVAVLELPQTEGWTCLLVPFGGPARCSRIGGFPPGTEYLLYWKVRAPVYPPPLTGHPNAGVTVNAVATASPGGFPPNVHNKSTNIRFTDLALEKFSDHDVVNVGAPYQYSLHVTNASAFADTSRTSVVDQLPAGVVVLDAWGVGWTCDQSGQQITCQQSWDSSVPAASSSQPPEPGIAPPVLIDVLAPAAGGILVNNATVDGPADYSPGNNTAQHSIIVIGSPDATDLQLSNVATGSALVPEGSPYSYVFTVKNNGAVAEQGVITVHAIVPAAITIVDVIGGNGWTCSWAPRMDMSENLVTCLRTALDSGATAPAITLDVLAGPPGADLVRAWTTGTADTNPSNNIQSATKLVVASAAPDLGITRTADPYYPTPADRGSCGYTLDVAINGSGSASGTTIVTDVLPSGVGFANASTRCNSHRLGFSPPRIRARGRLTALH